MTNQIKKIFHLLGFDIRRYNKLVEANKNNWFKDLDIHTIIDVGANIGQSALKYNQIFPNAFIYSFEPTKKCYEKLEENLKSLKNHKSFNLALGSKKEKAIIYLNEFDSSSSILRMTDIHKSAFPFAKSNVEENIEIDTLDNFFKDIDLAKNFLLKIDVQGFEKEVLLGAQARLKDISVIIVEISFLELYEGSPKFSTIYEMLNKAGFEYIGSGDQYNNPLDGRPLQQDAIFLKQ